MKARNALIAWTPIADKRNPTAGQVRIGLLLDEKDRDWTSPYAYTGGAANTDRRSLRGHAAAKMVFVDFNTLVVRDGIAPDVAHAAFIAIDEYALAISPDIPGAREG